MFNRRIYGGAGSERNRPSTSINFSLPIDSYVNIWIEETCGDTVIVLMVDVLATAGYQSITWNADDSNGNQVVNGAYIVTLLDLSPSRLSMGYASIEKP